MGGFIVFNYYMPELPEVETTVRELRKKIINRKINGVWSDFEKIIKKPAGFDSFKKKIKNKKITAVKRRGKNIVFDLSGGKVLLLHQKMTGHLLVGKWEKKGKKWISRSPGAIAEDKQNKYLHLIFFLDDGRQLALSNLRKFARVEFWDKEDLEKSEKIKKLGEEPLSAKFTFQKFIKSLNKRHKGRIKQVLMDQSVIAGIGNIYASEILWEARVNPFKDFKKLTRKELKKVFKAIKKILKKGIELKGASYSDYRRVKGRKGGFQDWGRVYDKERKECPRCGTAIERKKDGGRSTYFCPHCQQVRG